MAYRPSAIAGSEAANVSLGSMFPARTRLFIGGVNVFSAPRIQLNHSQPATWPVKEAKAALIRRIHGLHRYLLIMQLFCVVVASMAIVLAALFFWHWLP